MMGWKNWPAWLKGGVIGGLAYLVIIIISGLMKFPYLSYPASLLSKPLLVFCASSSGCSGEHCLGAVIYCGLITTIPVSIILGFVIGALIGLIVRKIRSRK